MKFGKFLKKCRESEGIGLRAMAGRVGCSPSYLSRLECCNIDNVPSEQLLRKLAAALSLDADELLCLARRFPDDVAEYVLDNPRVLKRLRAEMMKVAA